MATESRAESAPAGRLDSAPLGRQQKQMMHGVERPLPVLPKQAKEKRSRIRRNGLKKPPLLSRSRRSVSSNTAEAKKHQRDNNPDSPPHGDGSSPNSNAVNNRKAHNNKRMNFQSDPLADRCSIALGRTESILVSAAGDVLVCRCRRSSMPYIAGADALQDPFQNPMILNILPCCDADCGVNNLTAIEGPWSPVFDSLTVTRQISSEAEMSQVSEASVYEWEASASNKKSSSSSGKDSTQHSNHSRTTATSNNKNNSTSSGVNLSPFRLKAPLTPSTAESTKTNHSITPLIRRIGSLTIQTTTDVTTTNLVEDDSAVFNDSKEQESRTDEEMYESCGVGDTGSTGALDSSFMDQISVNGQISPAILPLPSFDYSHIHEGHNDMLKPSPSKKGLRRGSSTSSKSGRYSSSTSSRRRTSQTTTSQFPTILESSPMEEKKEEDEDAEDSDEQKFLHGVPVFLTHLSQIRIRVVSAHPLGAHVMLISEEALLFTYGLNNHGQLGIGVRSNIKDETRGFHTTPTLVTPLLENGGKTIHCAAGVDHSLVVVATEGRRLHKIVRSMSHDQDSSSYSDHGALRLSRVTSQPSNVQYVEEDDTEADSVTHHQVYGFGCNEFMKIGLVSSAMNEDRNDETEEGDILLPHRVALHCTVWPSKNDRNTSHFPPHGIFEIAASAEHSAALVRRPTGDIEVYTWGNATLGALGLPIHNDSQSLDDKGTKANATPANNNSPSDNIFPLPTVVESLSYRPHKPSSVFPRGVSLGPYSSFVLLSNGKCMSFGYSAVGMLGHGYGGTHSMKPEEVFLPNHGFASVSAGAFHVVAIAEDGQAYSWGINSHDRLGLGTGEFANKVQVPLADGSKSKSGVGIEWVPQCVDCPNILKDPVILACAGYDCSMLVTSSGQVYSFGKRSGKLGKGELVADVSVPEPLYGGLRLFHNRSRKMSGSSKPKKSGLTRMDSEGNLRLHGGLSKTQKADV